MRPRFLDPLRVEKIGETADSRPIWKLLSEFRYDSDILGCRVAIPAGFITDLASVPRAPLAYWLTGNTATEAAVLHDFLYSRRSPAKTKDEADDTFWEAMTAMGVPWWRRRIMWRAVQIGGASAWQTGPARSQRLNA